MHAVIGDHRDRAGEANEQLVQRAVSMLSPHLLARNVEDDEIALRDEGKPISSLSSGEVSSEVFDERLVEQLHSGEMDVDVPATRRLGRLGLNGWRRFGVAHDP